MKDYKKHILKINNNNLSFLEIHLKEDTYIHSVKTVKHNGISSESKRFSKEEFVKSLRELEIDSSVNRVNIVISDFLLKSSILTSFQLNEKEDINDQIQRFIKNETGISESTHYFDYKLFRNPDLSLMLLSAEREFINKIENALKTLKINVSKIEPESTSIIRLILKRVKEYKNRNFLLIHIGEFQSLIFAVQETNPVLYKIINSGASHIKNHGKNLDLLPENFSSDDNIEKILSNIENLGSGFKTLVNEINKTVRGIYIHFQVRHFFDSFVLTGNMSDSQDFQIYLEEILKIPIVRVKKGISLNNDLKNINLNNYVAEISSAIYEESN